MDDAALVVDVLVGKQQAVGPVVEDIEARVDVGRVGGGDVVDIIDGLVDAGVGIEVGTELHADFLAELHHAVALEMLAAVEAHVLQEVGEAALVLLFEDGTHLLCDVKVDLVLGLLVVTDVIG